MAKNGSNERRGRKADDRLFSLVVDLLGGPMTEEFAARNKMICRTILMRGDQTLDDLHETIFQAFDRWDAHMYEFQLGGAGPMDPRARRYGLDGDFADPFADEDSEDARATPIGSVGLSPGDVFWYWFDFGDDWWHEVKVVSIAQEACEGEYPQVVHRVGESPPQYVDDDEDDEDGWGELDECEQWHEEEEDAKDRLAKSAALETVLSGIADDYQSRMREIIGRTDALCNERLGWRYRDLCRRLVLALHDEGVELVRGKMAGWAAGVAYTLGQINLLTRLGGEGPYMASDELAVYFGVSMGTMQSRARDIREAMGEELFESDWELDFGSEGPTLDLFTVAAGLLMNMDNVPPEMADELFKAAYEAGLIPEMPGEGLGREKKSSRAIRGLRRLLGRE